jgi:hypothetical protein
MMSSYGSQADEQLARYPSKYSRGEFDMPSIEEQYIENQLQLGNDLEVTESQDLNPGGISDKKDLDRSKVSDKKKSVEL